MAALELFDFQAGLPGQLVSFASDLEIRLAIEQDVEPSNKQNCHYWYVGPNDCCSANDGCNDKADKASPFVTDGGESSTLHLADALAGLDFKVY